MFPNTVLSPVSNDKINESFEPLLYLLFNINAAFFAWVVMSRFRMNALLHSKSAQLKMLYTLLSSKSDVNSSPAIHVYTVDLVILMRFNFREFRVENKFVNSIISRKLFL